MCEAGQDYCEDPDNYPTEIIAEAIATHYENVEEDEKTETIPPRTRRSLHLSSNTSYPSSSPLCSVHSYTAAPRAARNTDGRFRFVVNGDHGQELDTWGQLVRVTQCRKQGVECGHGRVISSSKTMCRQGYSEHRLVAVEEGGRLVRDTFLFPSFCTCYSGGL